MRSRSSCGSSCPLVCGSLYRGGPYRKSCSTGANRAADHPRSSLATWCRPREHSTQDVIECKSLPGHAATTSAPTVGTSTPGGREAAVGAKARRTTLVRKRLPIPPRSRRPGPARSASHFLSWMVCATTGGSPGTPQRRCFVRPLRHCRPDPVISAPLTHPALFSRLAGAAHPTRLQHHLNGCGMVGVLVNAGPGAYQPGRYST